MPERPHDTPFRLGIRPRRPTPDLVAAVHQGLIELARVALTSRVAAGVGHSVEYGSVRKGERADHLSHERPHAPDIGNIEIMAGADNLWVLARLAHPEALFRRTVQFTCCGGW
ncbi:MAG TPA: hypothetical protein VMF69_22265 [Gemmataceae bacterium]|nr:hypothetical protein [Gemmataceae bacterium]